MIPPTKPPRRFRQLSQPDNVDSSCSPSCSYRRRTPRGSTPRGEAQKNEALDLQGLRSGGDSWTRTNDPFDVNEVLYRLSHATMLSYLWPTSSVGHLVQFVLPTEPCHHNLVATLTSGVYRLNYVTTSEYRTHISPVGYLEQFVLTNQDMMRHFGAEQSIRE